jgi:hypothetical protein
MATRVLLLSFILSAPALAPGQVQPRFEEQVLDTQLGIGYGVASSDVDGDGAPDIVLVDKDEVAWYRNPTWAKHRIIGKLTDRDHVCIAARDIDGDGKAEIAVGAQWNPGETQDTELSGGLFFLAAPEDRTKEWTPIRIEGHEPTTHRMRWVRNRAGRFDLVVLPLHGRGNVKGEGDPVRVLAYHPPSDPRETWDTSLVQASMHMTHNFDVVPAPEGDPETLLIAGREGIVELAPSDKGWREHWISRHPPDSEELQGAGEVRMGALGGGRPYVVSIEPMHGNQLVTYVPPLEGPKDGQWTRIVLDDSLVDGHALASRDLLGLANRQIVVGWRAGKSVRDRVGVKLWWTTKEDGSGWQSVFVDDNTMACEDLLTVDLNGDGKRDIVACGRRSKNLKVYWQK